MIQRDLTDDRPKFGLTKKTIHSTVVEGENIYIEPRGDISAEKTEYVGGEGISVSNGVISVNDTVQKTLTAGENIKIENNIISLDLPLLDTMNFPLEED